MLSAIALKRLIWDDQICWIRRNYWKDKTKGWKR